MKKLLLTGAVAIAVLASCKKEEKEPAVQTETALENAKIVKECYQGVLVKDTVTLAINITEDKQIRAGRLDYNFFEKDKNKGRISGEIKGDTIFGIYKFMSEGQMSTREVVFLRKGDDLFEGYGDIVTDSVGDTKFKDRSKLKFDSKLVLSKKDCN